MTHPTPRGSAFWHVILIAMYRLVRLLDPLLRTMWRRSMPGLEQTIELRVPGRRTGRSRSTLLTLLTMDDGMYIGHPNGPTAWTRNVEAADGAELVWRDGVVSEVHAVRLWAGPERDRVILATASQQPFPANVVYALARSHIRRVGAYYRLVTPDASAPGRGANPA